MAFQPITDQAGMTSRSFACCVEHSFRVDDLSVMNPHQAVTIAHECWILKNGAYTNGGNSPQKTSFNSLLCGQAEHSRFRDFRRYLSRWRPRLFP